MESGILLSRLEQSTPRREILDWYHLMENLHKVGGSNQRLRQAKNYLWQGLVNDAIAVFDDFKKKQARNFQNYLRKHRFRIPDYQLYQELSICIGSGSVESWIKQIGSRIKIVGAQWNPKNVSQMLRLRCAYIKQAYWLEYLCLVKKWDAPKATWIDWRFTTEDARIKLKKLYPSINS